MRNIFDQYQQPENRLTHALASALGHDRSLIHPFLNWLDVTGVPKLSQLKITEQQMPGETVGAAEDEASGLPDMCVFDDDSWCVLFEAKVAAQVSTDQLRRHRATAIRNGYEVQALIVIAVDPPRGRLPKGASQIEWREVYAWFSKRQACSFWARQFVKYMQVFESQMIAKDYSIRGTITMFDGLRFDSDNPYTYREGKRLIRLLGDELQARPDLRKIGIDPKGQRRSAITGRGGSGVWDFLPLRGARNAKQFTDFPHLTLAIGSDFTKAAITIPNGVKGGFRSRLRELEFEGFIELIEKLNTRLRPILRRSRDSKALVYVVQRHYRSQRSGGIMDGRLDADLRTVIPGGQDGVKYQPEWMEAIYSLLTNKRSNIQFGVDVRFSYSCPQIRSSKAVDLFAKSWVALSPVLDLAGE